jgi:hypothetical protein
MQPSVYVPVIDALERDALAGRSDDAAASLLRPSGHAGPAPSPASPLSPILAAAIELQAFCQARCGRFCFIGGIVVPRWGEPRTTADADLTLLTGCGGEEAFIIAQRTEYWG